MAQGASPGFDFTGETIREAAADTYLPPLLGCDVDEHEPSAFALGYLLTPLRGFKQHALTPWANLMIVQKKSRDDIAQMLRKEFHWEQLHLDRGLDGALGELKERRRNAELQTPG